MLITSFHRRALPAFACVFALMSGCQKGVVGEDFPRCADGVRQSNEECDDGNTRNGDGCTSSCEVEDGFVCEDTCVLLSCGDSIVDEAEACDDGNTQDGDGCAANCLTIETGYVCPFAGVPCNASCGDGIVAGLEVCDDGNQVSGDGCYGDCGTVEEGFICSAGGGSCAIADICGNGVVEPGIGESCDAGVDNENSYNACALTCQPYYRCGDGILYAVDGDYVEACDDGNAEEGDGCSAMCEVEPGFVCRVVGTPCTPDTCGNGTVEMANGEVCDDGNVVSGDGCSDDCGQVEAGYLCATPGVACSSESCSDGIVAGSETCDDGNAVGGDGCSSRCRLEDGFDCPIAGTACVAIVCGDGSVDGLEACDDGNTATGDGCDDLCEVEVGFECPAGGGACSATTCGDGEVRGAEQCDDGDAVPGDGCDDECQLEDGFYCPVAGDDCLPTSCGDGLAQGLEECDDGTQCEDGTPCAVSAECAGIGDNACLPRAGDGCDPLCRTEAIFECQGDSCLPVCGDGVTIIPEEECDDGNLSAGDGCSAQCTIEAGYECTDYTNPTPASIEVPITYRDFDASHPDFQAYTGSGCTGLVEDALGADGKPVLLSQTGGCGTEQISSEAAFDQWYRDVDGVNITFLESLPLTQDLGTDPSGKTYVFDSAPLGSNGGFYPLNDRGFGNYFENRNYHFTSEMRAYFRYEGGEVLDFRGDDDVWVFVNGWLAVDLGGLHPALEGDVTLSDTVDPQTGLVHDSRFNIYEGGIYEIVLFQAERRTTASNYKLTLAGFVNTGTAFCEAVCGDREIRGAEECDDGNTVDGDGCDSTCVVEPLYACTGEPSDCEIPPCGNGAIEYPEQCDDGDTDDADGCSSTCLLENCGNGILDLYETCDDGNAVDGDACTNACQNAVCGDGVIYEGVEECDDGNNVNTDLCTSNTGAAEPWECQVAICGDGYVGPGETCDDGVNNGGYGSCLFGCTAAAPSCGDGILQSAYEECDDGEAFNVGGYGACRADCVLDARCGDGVIDSPQEQCDDGNTAVGDGCGQTCQNEFQPEQ